MSEVYPDIPELPKSLILEQEYRILGMYFSGHPLDGYEDQLKMASHTILQFDEKFPDRTEIVLGGRIASLERRKTKAGRWMAKGEWEDKTNRIRLCIFPQTWEIFSGELKEGWIGFVKGVFNRGEGFLEIFASDFRSMRNYLESAKR